MPGKKYTKEDLACALAELKKGGSVRKVALTYGIPHTTLQDYKNNRYAHTPHPNRALTVEEEKILVNYILWMNQHGFPVTRAVGKALALTIIKSSQRATLVNLDKGLSSMWWSRFRARHPELTSELTDALLRAQVHRAALQTLGGLFAICGALYQKHGLVDKPNLIFNCNETVFWDKPQAVEKLPRKKRKEHICAEETNSMEIITVHCCVSAAGESIPPFVIFPRCLPSTSYVQDGPTNALYGVSPKGFIDKELFLEWLAHFVKYAPKERPLLLYLNQHETHVSKEIVDFCKENSIEVMCLPEHTTHLLQPLDVAVFGPLKTAFTSMASSMGLVDGDMVVGKRQFSTVLKHAYQQAVTSENIREGFRKTGLFPLCDPSQMVTFNPSSSELTQGTSLQEAASADAPPSSTSACPTCQSLPSPLVQSGIILEGLADILVSHRKGSGKNSLPVPCHMPAIPRQAHAAL